MIYHISGYICVVHESEPPIHLVTYGPLTNVFTYFTLLYLLIYYINLFSWQLYLHQILLKIIVICFRIHNVVAKYSYFLSEILPRIHTYDINLIP